MYHGMDVSLYINPMNAPGYKRADQMAADITLDGYRFLTTDYTTVYNMGKNSVQGLRGTVLSKLRTNEAELDIWFRGAGYAMRNEKSSTTCNWDGTDCYFARIYPHIDSISETSGSDQGGQTLTITGNSFEYAKTVEVTVDDVPCDIKARTGSSITCVTGAKTLGAPQLSYAGEHGLYRSLVNDTSGVNAANFESFGPQRTLLTSAEIPVNYYVVNSFDMIQGFYEAPVDGEYQFHMSCDDSCSLRLSLTDPSDPAAAEQILSRGSYTGFRNFYYADNNVDDPLNENIGKIFSVWIRLVGGQKYYMESTLGQGNGEHHWSVGVEIKPDVAVPLTHRHLKPGRQEVIVHQDLQRDVARFVVRQPDSGTYRIMMLRSNLEYFRTDEIRADTSAGDFRNKIKGYYKKEFGTDPLVDLECVLNNGTVTLSCSHVNVTERVYTITVPKSID